MSRVAMFCPPTEPLAVQVTSTPQEPLMLPADQSYHYADDTESVRGQRIATLEPVKYRK